MSQPRLAALAVLGLVTVTAAGLALQQYRRAESLAELLAAAQANAAQAQALSTARPKSPQQAENAADGAQAEATAQVDEAAPDAPPDERRDRRNNRPNPGAIMEKLMQDPEIAQAMRTQQNAMLDGRYAALFAKLNLPPAQLAQLKDLLAERMNVPRDVMAAARDQGMFGRGSRDELRSLIDSAQNEIDQEIISSLGQSTYAALQTYEDTASERRLVDSLASRLSYSSTPLNATQADALVSILSSTTSESNRGGNFRFGPEGGGNTPLITDATISAAQSVLGADQVSALVQLQQEQAAAATVRDAMRAQFQSARSAGEVPPPEPPDGGD